MSWELGCWKQLPTSGKKRGGYEGASLVCPHCSRDARFVERRGKWYESLLGSLRVERCYYHCRGCGRGHVPWDQALGLGVRALTPAASEVASLVGVQTSFAQAAEVTLQKLCGLRLSESSVERVTEGAGERLAKLLEEKVTFGERKPWTWQRDARGKTCAYVGLDATGVRQQTDRGAKADGRMAYVGMLYNPRSKHDERAVAPHCVRYLAGFYELDELGLQLRRQAAQVGWDQAEQQIALSDGGNGLEEFFRKNFPRAECILDFWHAAEHLTELGLALYPDDESQRQERVGDWCHQLKHEGGASVLATLEQLELSEARASIRATHADCVRYFQNHRHRMPYLANGWQIGSGPVESACKTVVANRLKGSGMRWGEDGSDAVCHLRALYLSQPGQWESYWKNYPN
jgi:hypothetical protein